MARQGGVGVPGGYGLVRAKLKPESDLPPLERAAAALEALAFQFVNAPVLVEKAIQLAAGDTDRVDSNQKRVNTLTVTCTAGMLDVYYGDQSGNVRTQPSLRVLQGETKQLALTPNQWTVTVCAGAVLPGAGCVGLSWTNGL